MDLKISFIRRNGTWGLARITQSDSLDPWTTKPEDLHQNYTYDMTAGTGVDIYIVDSGVRTSHQEFGGRAIFGVSYVRDITDQRGHGTHVAGTAAGSTYGVAKVRDVPCSALHCFMIYHKRYDSRMRPSSRFKSCLSTRAKARPPLL
jgi:subtilisin family serine protease